MPSFRSSFLRTTRNTSQMIFGCGRRGWSGYVNLGRYRVVCLYEVAMVSDSSFPPAKRKSGHLKAHLCFCFLYTSTYHTPLAFSPSCLRYQQHSCTVQQHIFTKHHHYQYSIATLGSLCSLLHITNTSTALLHWAPCALYFTSPIPV